MKKGWFMSENKESEMSVDEYLLRYRIHGVEFTQYSTVTKSACIYIYLKSGMADELAQVSNIDFVMALYALHGIKLKKHVLRLDGKETEISFSDGVYGKTAEVLYMSLDDWRKLNREQQEFLDKTIPITLPIFYPYKMSEGFWSDEVCYPDNMALIDGSSVKDRFAEIINLILLERAKKAETKAKKSKAAQNNVKGNGKYVSNKKSATERYSLVIRHRMHLLSLIHGNNLK